MKHIEPTEKLSSREDLIQAGYPFGKAAEGIPFGDRCLEQWRTNPDVTVFVPQGDNRYDNDNEHFLVFPSPDGEELLAVWTQSSCEGTGDNHLVLARSRDGEQWTTPTFLVGTTPEGKGKQAAWGFPVINRRGRIYLFYTREDCFDNNAAGSGKMGCIYSDDKGYCWSSPDNVPMPHSKYDNPDKAIDKNWIVWQNVMEDKNGLPLAFCTQITSNKIKAGKPGSWVNVDSRCFLIRFENLDENPEPAQIRTTWLPEDDEGITVNNPLYPDIDTAQEPSAVLLPDGRLFLVMRTVTGFIYYSVSEDNGASWRTPAVLLDETGEPFAHPLSPCPIYRLQNGKYLLLHHNNPGSRLGFEQSERQWSCNYANFMRNPTYLSLATFSPDQEQPLVFQKPISFLDSGDIAVGPKKTAEVGTYPSVTQWKGKSMLWYPDRKFYLLGKELPPLFTAP